MFKVLILLCSVMQSPSQCDRYNAIDVIVGPPAANDMECNMHAQAYAADAGIVARKGEYIKYTCTHTSIGKTVG